MKDTDGWAEVPVQRYLGGSGNLNYCLGVGRDTNGAVEGWCVFPFSKTEEVDLEMYSLCLSVCCKNPPNRCIIIGVLSRAMLKIMYCFGIQT